MRCFSELSFSDNQKDAADYLLTHIISEDHASTNVQQLFAFLVAFFQSLDLPNNEFLTSIDVDLVHREDVLADVPIDHLESLITDFINHIHLLLSKDPNQKETQRIVGTIDAYLENHYDEDIDLKHLGLEVNRNPSYISSLYKQKTGMNVKDRLRRIRIQAARELLEKGGFSVKEVAYTVGFSDPNYFSTVFKRETGLSATDYMLFYHKNIEEI
jgi:YesN/AraC family two-component response regulator